MRDQLPSHRLIIQTTLDPELQKVAEESIAYHLHQYGQQYRVTQAATVILDNNGGVCAIVGGVDYKKRVNLTEQHKADGKLDLHLNLMFTSPHWNMVFHLQQLF